jgi:hypothetical protein
LASNALVIGGGAGAAPATTTTGTGVLTALGNTTNAASGIAVKDANANLSSNNLFETLTVITAAGTVTTLTASSAYSFVVNGSGGQTIQLPDATTLPVGAVYRFNNNQSSGTVIVRNNSSTTVATLQSGSAVETTLLVNSPAAGTWDVHTLAPTNASWSTNTLTWTGTIGSGGAGSTWNAVPITVPYGGTGVTTSALGSIVVGSGSNTAANLSIGSTSQVLTVVGGTAAWATPGGVSTITFGSTGLTPATATSGAVTVAGTLAVANGGTGLTTTPANGALDIGNGTGFTRTTLTAGTNITITNAAGAITIASTGVTSIVAGTGITVSGTTAVTVNVATTLGAVGTYAYLASSSNASITAGTTYAGSGLRYSGFQNNNYSSSIIGCPPTGVTTNGGPEAPLGGTPSGTWQAMGTVAAGSKSTTATLFIRTV